MYIYAITEKCLYQFHIKNNNNKKKYNSLILSKLKSCIWGLGQHHEAEKALTKYFENGNILKML